MTWNVHVARDAAKQLRKLPQAAQKQIERAFESMSQDPLAGDSKPLKGALKGLYRRRVGRYRLIFILHPDPKTPILSIASILPRTEKTYRRR